MANIDSGKIEIDGVDIASISRKALRHKLAIIPQVKTRMNSFFQKKKLNKILKSISD